MIKILPILFFLMLLGYNNILHFFYIILPVIIIISIYIKTLKLQLNSKIKTIKFIKYIIYLLKEITISSFQTAKIIISPKMKINSVFSFIKTDNNELKTTIYANSITLTPGTITIITENDKILVHALQKNYIDELKKETMYKKISNILC